ncbi:MAG: hypothetical protein U0L85_00585 [Bacilli bacterium]|nr:hypothetical protein [Bacilli bacterium]
MLILEFDNVEDGLHLNDDTINDIEIIQDNQIISDYSFKIKRISIEIMNYQLNSNKDISISIGYKNYYEINLYNK